MPMYPNKAVMVIDNILIQSCNDPIHLYIFILSGVDLKTIKGSYFQIPHTLENFRIPFNLNRIPGFHYI